MMVRTAGDAATGTRFKFNFIAGITDSNPLFMTLARPQTSLLTFHPSNSVRILLSYLTSHHSNNMSKYQDTSVDEIDRVIHNFYENNSQEPN